MRRDPVEWVKLRRRANELLERALLAVQRRKIRELRRAQADLCDLLSGEQLVRIAQDYEVQHGIGEESEVA